MMFWSVKMERYRVLERLGSGGFGETFKAIALEDISERCPKDTLVTIKSFYADDYNSSSSEWAISGYRGRTTNSDDFIYPDKDNESKMLIGLSDPKCISFIPCFVETFTWTSPFLRTGDYMVSLFIPGITLHNWLALNPERSIETVYLICQQIFGSVAYIHKQGISHNDLHESNILIDPDCRPHLIDFGIATGDLDKKVTKLGYEGTSYLIVNQLVEVESLSYVMYLLMKPATKKYVNIRLFAIVELYQTDLDPHYKKLLEVLKGITEIEPRKRWTACQVVEFLDN